MSASDSTNRPHRVDRLLAKWRTASLRPLPPTLTDGAHVAIVGAGPAGSFSAHFLRTYARERGFGLRLTIFDAKDFTRSGPAGCNMCAGVVTGSLISRLQTGGITLPESVVQNRVSGFRLITRAGSATIRRDAPGQEMVTVFRGNGPRFSPDFDTPSISFDDSLLDAIEADDLTVIREPVSDIRPPEHPEAPVELAYGRGDEKQSLSADLVVGAFGLNARLSRQLAGTGYRSPRTVRACQAELLVGSEHIDRVLHGEIQVFSLGSPGVSFAALIPKGDFVTCTLIGRSDLGLDDLLEFLDQPRVRARLPKGWEIPRNFCHCHPGIVVSHAARPYASRLAMVGDAACCRHYKNGIETALDSAAVAAFTATHVGVSAEAFRRYYAASCDRLVNRDNSYGRFLFRANSVISRRRAAARAFLVLCRAPGAGAVGRRMREALWGLFAGDRPYRSILRTMLHPRVLAAAAWQTLVHIFRRPRRPPEGMRPRI